MVISSLANVCCAVLPSEAIVAAAAKAAPLSIEPPSTLFTKAAIGPDSSVAPPSVPEAAVFISCDVTPLIAVFEVWAASSILFLTSYIAVASNPVEAVTVPVDPAASSRDLNSISATPRRTSYALLVLWLVASMASPRAPRREAKDSTGRANF